MRFGLRPSSVLFVVCLAMIPLVSLEDPWSVLKRVPRVRRVIGGMEAVEGQWPWLAHLHGKVPDRLFWGIPLSYRYYYCGATVIGSRWVLTAAHCLRPKNAPDRIHWPRYWHIRVGETDNSPGFFDRLKSLFGSIFQKNSWVIWNVHADRMIIHENYNPNAAWSDDIALLRLRDPLPIRTDSNIGVASLVGSDADDWLKEGTECIMKGWGCDRNGGPVLEKARFVPLPKVEDQRCQNTYGIDVSKRFCAGVFRGGRGICSGDSGGPLVCKNDNRWYLAGIASFTSASRPGDYPGVFTKVSKYLDWIRTTIDRNS